MRIAVLFGGTSEERDVSIASAAQIIPALRSIGYEVIAYDTAMGRIDLRDEQRVLSADIDTSPPSSSTVIAPAALADFSLTNQVAKTIDLIFLALHGGSGEDGRIQAALDLAGIAYTGSNHIASAVCMDKDLSKRLMASGQVETPAWLMAPVSAEEVAKTLGWPVVVKPNKQGSTVGLSVVNEASELQAALTHAGKYDTEIMIESFIRGREFTVGVLDGVALPVGEIIPPGEIFDYQSKYQRGGAREQFPAALPPDVSTAMQKRAVRVHQLLKLGSYSRVDFKMDDQNRIWCLEANSLPGMTATSLLPQAGQAAGISFPELLRRICVGAIRPVIAQHRGEM